MRILVLGDIHGRTIWKDIIEKENPDKVIFLGDYVSTHGNISSTQQLNNLEDILAYKEDNLDKVILLRGNHDLQHLGYYWAECSGLDREVLNYMSEENFKKRFLSLTQWIYVDEELRTIFSHSGISVEWLKLVFPDNDIDTDIDHINNNPEPSEVFGFTPDSPYDYYGNSVTQSLVWIRPQALCRCNISRWDQAVGHTPVTSDIVNLKKATKENRNIWLCDALGLSKYLLIENGIFIPSSYEGQNQ